jgi:hypothetical protein
MEIRLYKSVQALPGGNEYELSKVFLSKSEIEAMPGEELQACLFALLSINLPLTAHIYLEVEDGTKIRPIITAKPAESGGLLQIWGTGYDMHPEGSEYVMTLRVDVDLTRYRKDCHEEILKERKDPRRLDPALHCPL